MRVLKLTAAIVALAAVFLDANAPAWVLGAAAGAGAAVPAVAVHAALGLIGPSWRRAGQSAGPRARWAAYGVAGAFAAVAVGPWLVLVLLACGLVEVAVRSAGAGRAPDGPTGPARSGLPIGIGGLLTGGAGLRGLGAVAWLAVKVGALSYGGGFVIVPLMQHDAVDTRHIMTDGQFLTAVALGQITPGPVVQTVAVVGFAAAGLAGAAVAAVCAFTPSFLFVCLGAPRFDAIRRNARVQAFLSGAGPAAIGAIAGSAVTLALGLHQLWQYAVLAGAAVWLLGLRRGVVSALLGAAAVGVVLAVR
jgi:chromate transporter